MWSSFGFYDDATNDAVLAAMRAKLRPGGRLVVDTWNRDFFEPRQGERVLERAGRRVIETKRVVGNRMRVRLDYGGETVDELDFRLYGPEELEQGLELVLACRRFDEALPPTEDEPRMQLVLVAS